MGKFFKRLWGNDSRNVVQLKHARIITPDDLRILHSILKQVGSLEIQHKGKLFLTLSAPDKGNEIIMQYDMAPKKVIKLIERQEPKENQEEYYKRMKKDIAEIQTVLQALPEKLALLSTKEETASLKKSLKDIIQNTTKANLETVLQTMEEKQPSSIVTKKEIDKALDEFFTRLIDHLRTIVLEMTTAQLETERMESELTRENIFDLVIGEFYGAMVERHKDYGFFVRLLDKHGKKRKLQGLVHKSNIPLDITIKEFPIDSQITVKYIGYKEEDGEIKLAFSIPDTL